ncbi:hypothetical protein DCAR_0831204 [Daucus carota subsp. sativus]|uniref:Ubiquitin-like domain-containing protein n=2 Tax=Daucus carota subsp. sativus TaxID=79200 RepID=A0AAF0XPA8_DAUCS|nr:hypothetical protein DCAR_0831204 [Daucus carota subsp. sativus]
MVTQSYNDQRPDNTNKSLPLGAAAADDAVSINVRCSNGSKFSVRASVGSTVSQFKQIVAENCDVPAVQQRLIYKGRILKDDQTLDSYGLIGFCSWVSSCETRPWLR